MAYQFKTYYGNSQTKTVAPTTVSQEVTPDAGYLLDKVIVEAAAPNPETCSTVAELEAKMASANVGKVYKYTGSTTASYIQNSYYEVVSE